MVLKNGNNTILKDFSEKSFYNIIEPQSLYFIRISYYILFFSKKKIETTFIQMSQ